MGAAFNRTLINAVNMAFGVTSLGTMAFADRAVDGAVTVDTHSSRADDRLFKYERHLENAMRDRLLEMSARGLVDAHGSNAILVLRERAETARELGHTLASRTWQNMAAAAERMLIASTGEMLPFDHFRLQPLDSKTGFVRKTQALGRLALEFGMPDALTPIGDPVTLLQLPPGAKLQLMRQRVLREQRYWCLGLRRRRGKRAAVPLNPLQ